MNQSTKIFENYLETCILYCKMSFLLSFCLEETIFQMIIIFQLSYYCNDNFLNDFCLCLVYEEIGTTCKSS